ncbi:hypothetical protein HK103_006314 [Boothiomyces macroporosus]|uniref:Phosphodiesterase n=1 Tax=Boothiomyces macroporosus TaxID=261099 RepID=A0AAD5UE00_9FUNG|nr:hypothetical protein HK103_006314 [Boothiomyces macroporosus]
MSVQQLNLTLTPIEGYPQEKIDSVIDTIHSYAADELTGLGMDFNVFDWKREDMIGLFLGMFVKLDIVTNSKVLQGLFEFAVEISNNYFANPYHSFYHAIDVAYMVNYLFVEMGITDQTEMSKFEQAALLLSALGHDVLHPGTNNLYQVNSHSPVAHLYNNVSVLENQSADFMDQMMDKYAGTIQAMNLDYSDGDVVDDMKLFMREAILHTDMAVHFPMLDEILKIVEYHYKYQHGGGIQPSKTYGAGPLSAPLSHHGFFPKKSVLDTLKSQELLVTTPEIDTGGSTYGLNRILFETPGARRKLVMSLLHTAEKLNGLPISPNMDSTQMDQNQTQITFTQLIVQPIFECYYDLFPRTLSLMDLIADNMKQYGAIFITNPNVKRRVTDENVKPKKPISARSSDGGSRRMSMAAGTFEIPDSVQKYLARSKARGSHKLSTSSTQSDYLSEDFSIEEELETSSELSSPALRFAHSPLSKAQSLSLENNSDLVEFTQSNKGSQVYPIVTGKEGGGDESATQKKKPSLTKQSSTIETKRRSFSASSEKKPNIASLKLS